MGYPAVNEFERYVQPFRCDGRTDRQSDGQMELPC